MNNTFINKVKQNILEHIEEENFGVTELASNLGLSNSQLLRKVKLRTGKTIIHYIREIRLNEARLLIEETNFTAAEIAYKVGFSSPSYFSKCFHEYFGRTPGEFKTKTEESSGRDKIYREPVKPIINNFQRNIVLGISILIIVLLSYIFFDVSSIQKTKSSSLSIAVLPFKNLSDDKNNQYFTDGMMGVIINHLSGIEGLKVISKTTMEKYRETNKTSPEIAKELNIAYVLEASVQKNDDKVRIIIQLVDAVHDTYIWSDNIEREYKDIFVLQSDIARRIAAALERNLSPKELGQIENIPTKNLKAYNLYLKGRFFWQRRTEEGLKKSVLYFEEALSLDSTYAKAYAGLADAYYVMSWWGWYPEKEGYKKGKELAVKALYFDNSNSEAHAILGGIHTWHEYNWEKAETELKRAISLNPSYATAHQYYAELLSILKRNYEAREQIDLAIKLNPNAQIMYELSSNLYYYDNEFEKAIEEKLKQLDFINEKSSLIIFKSYVHLGMNKEAIEHIKIIVPNNSENIHRLIEKTYQESGINGLINWYIDRFISKENWGRITLYALVGDSQKVIESLEKYPKNILEIEINPDFNTLRLDPVFMEQFNKIKKAAIQDIKNNIVEVDL